MVQILHLTCFDNLQQSQAVSYIRGVGQRLFDERFIIRQVDFFVAHRCACRFQQSFRFFRCGKALCRFEDRRNCGFRNLDILQTGLALREIFLERSVGQAAVGFFDVCAVKTFFTSMDAILSASISPFR